MKYVCFGYYGKDKFDGMTAAEQNAMFDTCFMKASEQRRRKANPR